MANNNSEQKQQKAAEETFAVNETDSTLIGADFSEQKEENVSEEGVPYSSGFMVNRRGEHSKTDGKTYFRHYILAKFRGVEVRINFVPFDYGGHRALEIVFGQGQMAELMFVPYVLRDKKTGQVTGKGNSYLLQNVDVEGNVWACKVKIDKQSDKDYMKMLLTNCEKREVK